MESIESIKRNLIEYLDGLSPEDRLPQLCKELESWIQDYPSEFNITVRLNQEEIQEEIPIPPRKRPLESQEDVPIPPPRKGALETQEEIPIPPRKRPLESQEDVPIPPPKKRGKSKYRSCNMKEVSNIIETARCLHFLKKGPPVIFSQDCLEECARNIIDSLQ